MKQKRSPHH